MPIEWPAFTPLIPPALSDRLKFRGDRWIRTQAAVFLMAITGWSTVTEIVAALAERENLAPNSGAIYRLLREFLPGDEITYYRVLPYFHGLAVTRLGPLGREMCYHLDWPVKEADWLRLQLYHEGDIQLEHTAMILAFCREARVRGYEAFVLPAIPGKTSEACPDVYVAKDGEWAYVEVERGRDKPSKWLNQERLQRRAAVVALTPESRIRLVGEIKRLYIPLVAADLETLRRRTLQGNPGPLWIEKWRPQ